MPNFSRAPWCLCIFLALAPALRANQIVLPGSIAIAASGRDNEPAAAFNTVDRTWLIVWRQADSSFSTASSILGRIVREDRTVLTAPFQIGYGNFAPPPRVAHDPLRNEWMVVFAGDCVIDTCPYYVIAQKVASNGTLVGGQGRILSPGNSGEAFPDVVATRTVNTELALPPTPSFLVVWQQNISGLPAIVALRLFDDSTQPSRIGFTGSPFRVDVGANLPTDRRSTRPRVSSLAPLGSASGAGGRSRRESHPRIAFEMESGGQKDVWFADVNFTTVFAVIQVDPSPAAEDLPEVSWNATTGRSLVLYRRNGGEVYARAITTTSTSPFHAPLGEPFRVTTGSASTIAAQAGTDVYFASAYNAGNFGLGCIAGLRVAGTPAAGATNGDQLSLSASDNGNVMLLFRRPDGVGGTIVRASILTIPPAPLPNNAPTARAGADIQVTEGTLFSLDGSTSNDADGDPLRFQWARTDGGSPGDFFVAPAETEKPGPQLQAPSLGIDLAPLALTYELRVDDYRSDPAFPSPDTVTVTVVPGGDTHPPTASAGPDQTADEGVAMSLDGASSSDPDGDPLTFSWTVTQVTPPVVAPASIVLAGATTSRPTLTTPRFANPGGIDIGLRLAVTTPRGGTSADTAVIHVRDSINEPPVAVATGPAVADEGSAFLLAGDTSSDSNGDTLTFHWELTSTLSFNGNIRETVDLLDGDAAFPSVTAQIFNERDLDFQLTVRDPGGLEARKSVRVHIRPVPMRVFNVFPMKGSPGSRVTITGVNLYDPGTRVYFGSEDLARAGTIESITDSRIEVLVPSGGPSQQRSLLVAPNLGRMIAQDYLGIDSGPIIVKKGSERFTTSQDYEISHGIISDVFLSQGVQTYPLTKGKDTLIFVTVRPAPGPQPSLAALTNATLTVIPSTGPSVEISTQDVPATVLDPMAQVTGIQEGVRFFIPGSALQADRYRFAIRLYNHGVEVANAISDLDSGLFKATRSPRILAVRIVPFANGSVSPQYTPAMRQTFEDRIAASLETFRRVYPAPKTEMVYWPDEIELPELLHDDGKVYLEAFNIGSTDFLFGQMSAMNRLADYLDSWNNLHPDQRAQFVVGFVEESLFGGNSTVGFGVPPVSVMSDIVKFWAENNVPLVGPVLTTVLGVVEDIVCTVTLGLSCSDPLDLLIELVIDILDVFSQDVSGRMSVLIADDTTGETMAHEIGHNLGFVHPYSPEHDAQNISHSKYDEGKDPSTSQCTVPFGLNFSDVPGVSGPVFTVTSPGAIYNATRRAKALMSYACGRTNDNCFHEPKHYQQVFDYLRTDFSLPLGLAREGGGGADVPALRVSGGYAFRDSSVRIGEARPALAGEPLTPVLAKSPLRLVFLDAASHVLSDDGLGFQLTLPLSLHAGTDGNTENVLAFFRATRPIPPQTARAELRYGQAPVWTLSALGSPPQLTLLAPAGGEVVPDGSELRIRWSSSDADGGELVHAVYISRDGGATFEAIALEVRGTEHRWSTGATEGSDHLVVKVVASDGFHATEARSGELRVARGRPRATILSPEAGASLVSSQGPVCRGLARSARGEEMLEESAYAWSSSIAGPLGTGRQLAAAPLAAGIHKLRLEVSIGGDTASAEVEVTVLLDSDRDGIDDATEAAHGLDPNDPEDAYRDDDQDGLASGAEILDSGSDPHVADSDGDGLTDGRELAMGTSPIQTDTDGDGFPDDRDNCPLALNADQSDVDRDGIGDICDAGVTQEASFLRGDANGDGVSDISDAVGILTYLFIGGTAPACEDAADGNDDGKLDISDPLAILGYLFLGAAELPAPGPHQCGSDPTSDNLTHCESREGGCP